MVCGTGVTDSWHHIKVLKENITTDEMILKRETYRQSS